MTVDIIIRGKETVSAAATRARKSTKELSDEFISLGRAGGTLATRLKKTFDDSRSPVQRYRQGLKALDAAQQQNKITTDQYAVAVDQLGEEFRGWAREAEEASEKATEAIRKAGAATTRSFSTNALSTYNEEVGRLKQQFDAGAISQQTYAAGVARADRQFKATTTTLGSLKGAFASAFDIAPLAVAGAALAGAKKLIGDILNQVSQIREQAKEFTTTSGGGIGTLAQVARDKEDFAQLEAQTVALFRSGATATLEEAAQSVFSARSAGFDKELNTFAGLAKDRVIGDIQQTIQETKAITEGFGTDESGTVADVLAKSFAASQFTRVTAEDLTSITARAAAQASQAGFRDEEAFGAGAIVANVFGRDRGGARLNSLFQGIAEQNLSADGTKNLVEVIGEITKLNLTNKGLQEKLGGRKEAVEAFITLQKNLDGNDGLIAAIQATDEANARSKEILDERRSFAQGSVFVQQERAERVSVASERVGDVEVGVEAARLEQLRRQAGQALQGADAPLPVRLFTRAANDVIFGGLSRLGANVGGFDPETLEARRRAEETQEKSADVLGKMLDETRITNRLLTDRQGPRRAPEQVRE